ncbi:MAG: replication-associated recombination protein A [Vulcanimicrobiaceae bacterium]
MRPQTFDELVGHEEVIGAGKPLRIAIERDRCPSLILWGPPGAGKTTFAEIIAHSTHATFERISAVSAGVADLRAIVAQAKARAGEGRRTVLFIDEIHRFNKAQQDAVLPYVEDGTITLIGATTENPSFEVNSALLSRARVVVLHALGDDALDAIVERALHDPERGFGRFTIELDADARKILVQAANGDARALLNALEFAVASAPQTGTTKHLDLATMRQAVQRRSGGYDKAGDGHYDTVSAYIKSLRASDPDAAIYWLARMLDAGEEPLFLARRMVILASEDIGLADSQALQIAVAAQQAVHFLGMPEGYYALAHATLYLARAKKSNSVGVAYAAALADVRETRNDPVPLHLRNAPTGLMKALGYGRDYHYAHNDYSVTQENLPENLHGHRYYAPGENDR